MKADAKESLDTAHSCAGFEGRHRAVRLDHSQDLDLMSRFSCPDEPVATILTRLLAAFAGARAGTR